MAILPPSPLRVFPTKQHRALGTPANRRARVSPGTRPPASNFAAVTGDRGFFGKKSYTAACSSPTCRTSTIQCRSNTPVLAPNALVAARSNPSSGVAATKTSAPTTPAPIDIDASASSRPSVSPPPPRSVHSSSSSILVALARTPPSTSTHSRAPPPPPNRRDDARPRARRDARLARPPIVDETDATDAHRVDITARAPSRARAVDAWRPRTASARTSTPQTMGAS